MPAGAGGTARETGARAELAVAEHLEATGYAVVATNLRIGRYELDVVARKGALVVVVEVRTRGARSWTTGFGSIDAKKRLRVRRAAERLWRDRYRSDPSVERLRIDAASVTFENGKATIEYAVAAF